MNAATLLALVGVLGGAFDSPQVRVVRYDDDRLTGITAVDVVVLQIPASACGLSKEAIQDAAVKALLDAGTKATASAKASSWFYTVHVTAESTAEDGRCVTAIRTELRAQVDGIPEADRHAARDVWGSLLVGQMPLVSQSGLVSSTPADHAARAADMVRAHAAAIGARIKAANTRGK